MALSAFLLFVYSVTAVAQIFVTGRYNAVAIFETVATLTAIAVLFSSAESLYFYSAALFAMFAQFFGAMLCFYDKFSFYDIIMHLLSGILVTFVAHYLFTLLLKKIKSYDIPCFCGIAFSLLAGIASTAVWEIYEFTVDTLFGWDCQLNSLTDTMTDIIAGSIGALAGCALLTLFVFKTIGKRYVKSER